MRNFLRRVINKVQKESEPIRIAFAKRWISIRIAFAKRGIYFSKNDKKLGSIFGSAEGRDAVVLGMGPSFRPEDVHRFSEYLTFSCNKIFLMEDEFDWRPDYYCVTDFLVVRNNESRIRAYEGTEKFIHPAMLAELTNCDKIVHLHLLLK